jgi:hypothetical protein
MYQCKLNQARRGAMSHPPPIGSVKDPSSAPALDPDEPVQTVMRLIFDHFDRQGTRHGLLRYLVHHRIRIPVRGLLPKNWST